jgi:hypothetical protein
MEMLFFIFSPYIQHFKVEIIKKACSQYRRYFYNKISELSVKMWYRYKGQVMEMFPISSLSAEKRTWLKSNSL